MIVRALTVKGQALTVDRMRGDNVLRPEGSVSNGGTPGSVNGTTVLREQTRVIELALTIWSQGQVHAAGRHRNANLGANHSLGARRRRSFFVCRDGRRATRCVL